MTAVDFNHDGKLDLVEGTIGGTVVSLGDGTGEFGNLALPYPFWAFRATNDSTLWSLFQGIHPPRTALADLNSDGNIDLVVKDPESTSEHSVGVSIVLGTPTGEPGSGIGLSVFGVPLSLTVADFNLDGKPDLAVSGFDPSHGYGPLNPGYPNTNGYISILINSTPRYQTPVGSNSIVSLGQTTLTFDSVTTGGTTSVTPIDPATVGEVPGGFSVSNSVAYEIATTATFTGSVTLAFKVPGPVSQEDFNNLAILHNENGTIVDVTASTPARDYTNLTVYARTSSFSPFYLARRGPHVRSLFDQTKAYKSGSTIPIKLQLQNASNANISSTNTSLVARDLRFLSTNTTAPIVDSGNANPDYTFRYDSTLGGAGGGYIFNLSTRGLCSGQYVLSFYAGSDHSFFYTVKFEVK